MYGKILGGGALREQGIRARKKLHVMSELTQAAHGQKDLVLAAAPVGTRIEVQDFHAALAYTIAAADAIPTMASPFFVPNSGRGEPRAYETVANRQGPIQIQAHPA